MGRSFDQQCSSLLILGEVVATSGGGLHLSRWKQPDASPSCPGMRHNFWICLLHNFLPSTLPSVSLPSSDLLIGHLAGLENFLQVSAGWRILHAPVCFQEGSGMLCGTFVTLLVWCMGLTLTQLSFRIVLSVMIFCLHFQFPVSFGKNFASVSRVYITSLVF